MYGRRQDPSELDKLIRGAMSGYRSGARFVLCFFGSGIIIVNLIGKIEQQFYEVPVIGLTVWLVIGLFMLIPLLVE